MTTIPSSRRQDPEKAVRRLEALVAHRELQLLRGRRPAYVQLRAQLLEDSRSALERARRRLAATTNSDVIR